MDDIQPVFTEAPNRRIQKDSQVCPTKRKMPKRENGAQGRSSTQTRPQRISSLQVVLTRAFRGSNREPLAFTGA